MAAWNVIGSPGSLCTTSYVPRIKTLIPGLYYRLYVQIGSLPAVSRALLRPFSTTLTFLSQASPRCCLCLASLSFSPSRHPSLLLLRSSTSSLSSSPPLARPSFFYLLLFLFPKLSFGLFARAAFLPSGCSTFFIDIRCSSLPSDTSRFGVPCCWDY